MQSWISTPEPQPSLLTSDAGFSGHDNSIHIIIALLKKENVHQYSFILGIFLFTIKILFIKIYL